MSVMCVSGYRVNGNTSITCHSGVWLNDIPTCVCDLLPAPVNGGAVLSDDKMSVVFNCDVGYTLNGTHTSICDHNGTGWSSDVPQCISCVSLDSIEFGSVTLSTNGTHSSAQYGCDVGYTLSGHSVRYCDIHSQWSHTQPSCVTCPDLVTPFSGYMILVSDNITTEAVYSCMTGYTLDGLSVRTCLSNGTWTSQEPNCYCVLPVSPLHGDVVYGTTVNEARFTCQPGYTLNGYQNIYCQHDGTGWNNTAPICVLCDTLTLSAGIEHTVSSDGVNSMATFTCDVGYTMVGDDTLTCREDGTWDLQEPTCVTCDTITPPPGGYITFSTYNSITQAIVACDVSYTLVGTSTLTCRSYGSWDISTPSCVSCADLAALDSGYINVTTDGTQTTALVDCDTGYYIDGADELTCEIDGTWSDQLPTCKCDVPSSVDNGDMMLSEDGMRVDYSCDTGYTMTGSHTLTCHTAGLGWDHSQPTCVQCSAVFSPQNGSLHMNTNGTTTSVTFTCDRGFTLYGNTEIYCLSDGSWTPEPPTCVGCDAVTGPINGSYQWSTDGITSQVVYECSTGYSLVGTTSRTCSLSGTLEGESPTCVLCPALTQPDNGKVTIGSNGTTTYAVYECDSSYTIIGREQIECIEGMWDTPLSYCECLYFLTPSDGTIELSDNGSVAIYMCDVGYTLHGESVQTCEQHSMINSQAPPTCSVCEPITNTGVNVNLTSDGTITSATFNCDAGYTLVGQDSIVCRSDGSWSASAPTCVSCDMLDLPVGGTVEISTDGHTTTAAVQCMTGYTMSGTSTLTCKTDGTWDYTVPDCVRCETVSSPSAGSVVLSSNGTVTTASYTCHSGYYTTDDTIIVCDISGQWSATTPICVCESPVTVQNGNMTLSDSEMTVTYSCHVGFTLQGEVTRYCDVEGAGWTDVDPICSECPELLDFTNGTVTVTSSSVVTQASYSCDVGYTLSGSSVVQCLPNSTWSMEQPTCNECDVFEEISNGTVTLYSDGIQSVITYTCHTGFTLVGPAYRSCLQNGTWDSTPPTCVYCPPFDNMENGETILTSNDTVTIATFYCDSNYRLIGSDIVHCTSSGDWSTDTPTCVCSTFDTLAHGDIEIVNNGTEAVYSCDVGYTMSGEAVQQCGHLTVTGDTPTVPECVQCESIVVTSGLSVQQVTDGTITTAMFTCSTGTSLSGMSNITCRTDGTWQYTIPSCEPCVALTVSVGGDVSLISDGQMTTATFTCHAGYTLTGQHVLTCNSDGLWNFIEPSCVQCPSLSSPDSGTVNISTDGVTSLAVFDCQPGYHSDGVNILTCLVTGNWDNTPPLCVCDPPQPIENGNYTLTNNGLMVVYTCDVNYTMVGDNSTRYCDNNGGGFIGEPPTCSECSPLSYSTNGSIEITTDGATTTATFTCDQGYTLSGPTVIQCQQDSTWNVNIQPVCQRCLSLPDIVNGTFTMTTDGTSTHADYTCYNGFTLSGPVGRTCTPDNWWTEQSPSCVLCEAVVDPVNGVVTMTTNGSVTMTTFTCDTNYVLYGEDVIYCTHTGMWSSPPPTCVCRTFGQPDGGTIVISDDGSSVIYTCVTGTTLVGEPEQTCGVTTLTGHDYTVPQCVTCDTLPASSVAMFELSSDGTTTTASYLCPVLYTMIGTSNLTCRTDGTWDVTPPSCVSCSTLSVLTNGDVTMVTDGVTTQASFTCDPGTTLSGEHTLTCMADGGWNFQQPNCVLCPVLSSPQNGQISLTSDGRISVAMFYCSYGYYIDGEDVLTCTESGMWDNQPPICNCIPPVDLYNGTVTVSSDRQTVSYTCNIGHSLHGVNVRHCTTDGSGWSDEQSQCVHCETIPASTDQSYNLTSDGVTTVSQFYCNVGTSLHGSQTLACLSDGTWSDIYPQCVSCPAITVDIDVILQYISDGSTTTARYECTVGSTLVGDIMSQCTSSGVWNSVPPYCVDCPSMSHPNNGAVNITYNNGVTVATYSCNDGYSIVGLQTVYCLTTGNWSDLLPTCECDVFTVPQNGNIVISDDGTTAVFSCQPGYSMVGESTLTCTTGGSMMTQPQCVTCDTIPTLPGLLMNVSTDGHTSVSTFTCEVGYTMVGYSVLTCHSDGTWDNEKPICVSCSTVSPPLGGTISLQSDGTSTKATVTCIDGYTLVGESILSCKDDGSWDLDIPYCECNRPDIPDNSYITVSADSRTVTYHCYSGYTLSGPSQRYCALDGSWWSDSDPVCVQCSALTPSQGMNISFTHNENLAQAMFQCDVGYSLSHYEKVTCLTNGSWSTTSPVCVLCVTLNITEGLLFELITDHVTTSAVFTCADNYDMTGPSSVTCTPNGVWSMSQPYCVKQSSTLSEQTSCSNSAAIAFGVLFGLAVILIIILAMVLWRLWRRNKGLSHLKHTTYSHSPEFTKDNPLFTDIDRSSFIPSRAPIDYTRHVTDLGRADSSLAPTSHSKHVMREGTFGASVLSAPLSTRNININNPPSRPPTRPPTIGGRRSPVYSITPSSLRESSLDNYLPDQLLTLKEDSEISAAVLDMPKLLSPDRKQKMADKTKVKSSKPGQRRKVPESSLFVPIDNDRYREESPLPQQILTPRNPGDSTPDNKPRKVRGKKPKGDLIDQDKNLTRIYEQKGKRTVGVGAKSMKSETVDKTKLDHDGRDTDV